MTHWKRNLLFIWLSQFLAIMGFSFALPFGPFFLQELGVGGGSLKMWVSDFAAAPSLTLGIFSPLWGALADRYGRRLMMLRANFCGVLVLSLMALVKTPTQLVVLRLFQGALTGTMQAALTMVVSSTPSTQTGLAMGVLNAAVYSGSMAGVALGGFFADAYGYRMAFVISGLLLFGAALFILLGTREEFSPQPRPAVRKAGPARKPENILAGARIVFPILGLLWLMAVVRQFDAPLLPLVVQQIHGSVKGAATWTGMLSAVGCLSAMIAGVLLGRLSDRVPPPVIGRVCALIAGLTMIPQAFATAFPILVASRAAMAFCASGLEPVFQVWVAKMTPQSRHGAVFGWVNAARSFGWVVSPLASGAIAWAFGLRSIFFATAILYWALVPAIYYAVRRIAPARN